MAIRKSVGKEGIPARLRNEDRRDDDLGVRSPPSQKIEEQKIALIRAIGNAARIAATEYRTDREFHALLEHAVSQQIISVSRLSEIARVDRTTASRWINGHNTPPPLSQEAILLKIDDEAVRLSSELENKYDR